MGDTGLPPQKKTKPRQSSAGRARGSVSGTVSVDTETVLGNKAAGSGKSRSRNFVVWEDESLSSCYVNTSRDPVAGAYQKGPSYWEHIHRKWCVLHAAAPLEKKVYAEVRTVDQLYVRWKKHINKDMGVFMKYLGQVYSDMPTGTPEKEYIRVAAKRYKEALGKVFRFETCVPTLVQLARFSLNKFKRNKSTCLAVPAAVSSTFSEDEDDDGSHYFEEEEQECPNNNLEEVEDVTACPPVATGRFLTESTYAPPPGKTTGTKKAKAMLAVARSSSKKKAALCTPCPPSQFSVAAELVAKSVSEIKNEIAKLAGTTQDQLRLDEDKLKLEEVKLRLEEVNTYIRLGMREEAASSMAAFSAVKRSLADGRPPVEENQDDAVEHDDAVEEEVVKEVGGTLLEEDEVVEEDNEEAVDNEAELAKETAFLEDSSSSSSSLSSFRFRRPKKKKHQAVLGVNEEGLPNNEGVVPSPNEHAPPAVPESVVVDSGSRLFVPIAATLLPRTPSLVNQQSSSVPDWRLKKRKRRMESRASALAASSLPLTDRTNNNLPEEVEFDWQRVVEPTQLSPADDQSTQSGVVVYRGDTQKDFY
jgi:hypothetical protein